MFAEVILGRVTPNLDKIYHYSIPPEISDKLDVGHQVLIPFGKSNTVGYVVGFVETSEIKGIKDIGKILSPYPLFTRHSVETAKWIAEYYNSFLITALRLVMPPGTLKVEQRALKTKLRKPLYAKSPITKHQDTNKLQSPISKQNQFSLTEEQKAALRTIAGDIELNKFGVSLLFGITGSGKTEVYLRAAEYAVGHGGSAIILVPEVGLTPQIVERASEKFGDKLVVYYSDLPEKERLNVWGEVASGEKSVVLGTRSALFLPVKNLKLIVMDEEFENTYKSDQSPRYHTRDVAFHYAKKIGASVVLGSATPSVETFYHAKQGEYKLLTLPKRIDDRPLPPVEVIDMRLEMKAKNFNVLSRKLRDEIKSTFAKKEQTILFINRRGYFSFVMCRSCGHVIQCPKCALNLIYHLNDKKLRCNHCNFTAEPATVCPKCGSTSIKFFGGGTQRIEQEVANIIPKARILRLDRDTVTKKGSYANIIRSFISGSADVLIGTQMVTKGLDIGSVTLVGVVAADIGLNTPDFRAAEHVFQMITQVAGRAGRHKLAGKVIVQTYDPDNYAIKFAAKHDFEGFYDIEIASRKELGYPPFENLINLTISSEVESKAEQVAQDIVDFVGKRLSKESGEVFGPGVAPINKLKGLYRYQVIVKGRDIDAMRKAVVESASRVVKLDRSRITVDIDPYNML
jgi:primosomal protein N' (replication factor Y) (superfamily II helicase)